MTPEAVLVQADDERALIRSVLEQLGATTPEAAVMADIYTEADLRGVHSHGIQRLPVLVERIRKGLLVPGRSPDFTWLAPAILRADGNHGFGPYIAFRALEMLEPAAHAHGLALATIAASSHSAMTGHYCEQYARKGWILIAWTTSEPLVHPEGGATAMVGSNPIAMGFPLVPDPFTIDLATAAAAIGRIQDRLHRGQEIPPDWAVDKDGVPTTDAARALGGSLNPMGGGKGYALGLAFEILVSLLTGTPFGHGVRGTLDTDHVCTKGDVYLLIDPNAFPGFADQAVMARGYLDEVRESRPAAGGPGVRIPGDRARSMRAARLANGIPLSDRVWRQAQEIAASLQAAHRPR